MTTQPDDKLGQLSALGVAVWLDDISRERLRTGNLAELMRDFHVVGVTSNPTIFASALSKGDAYSEQLADIKVRKISVEQASWEITTYDIRWAADVLRPAYDASDGLDGRVSIEVDPRIARATAETVASAKFLWWAVDRPNLFIKIPATAEGVPAITQTLARGISVNVTLIFSLERYGEVIDAGIDDPMDVFTELAISDIQHAADILRPVHERTSGADGYVSLEVPPALSHDTDATIATARTLWERVDRPNLMIKIPATLEGMAAIHRTIADGRNVNVTLIFELAMHERVIEQYISALEVRHQGGQPLDVHSVASFFVSRVDTEVDGRLEKIGSADALALRGRAAIENARLAYELFEQRSATPRWEALKARGARPQRPLWASTSTKNPEYKDTMYVTDLVAPGTVNTMPEPTLHAIAGHGDVRGDTIHGTYDEARRYFEQLEAVGVSYDDVVQVLEDEGVEKFAISWNQLLDTIKSELADEGSR